MEISRRFMSRLTALSGWEMDFCYKHVAPNGVPALRAGLSTVPTISQKKGARGCGMASSRTLSACGARRAHG
jgi:hypothetical protein